MRRHSTSQKLRRTGITVLGDMPWGTHFCHFYETKQDLLETVIPYFKTGLENNEFCLWAVSEPLTAEEAASVMQTAVPDMERHLAKRNIEIVPHHEWYLKGGGFDISRVLDSWAEKLDRALASGYAGMRVHGKGAWLTERDRTNFLDYENKLNALIVGKRMIALCTYPLATGQGGDIFDVAQAHHFATSTRHGN
jgi:hypothetical protein